jgi:nitrate reductase gamma subunit
MHTLKVIFGGLLLLGVCLLLGRRISGTAVTVFASTIKYFLVLWLAATLVNMWVGVSWQTTAFRVRL